MTRLDGREIDSITFDDTQVNPVAVDSWVIVDLAFSKKSVRKLRGTNRIT